MYAAGTSTYRSSGAETTCANAIAGCVIRYPSTSAAYIQLKPDAEATEEEIIDFCKGKIATYRIPRYVRFVDDWPMSGTKIKKIVLREMIAEELKSKGITEAEKMTSS